MKTRIMIAPSEFQKGVKAFQESEPRDAMYKTATFLVNHFWGKPKNMADGMGTLLLTWNQAFYRYGSFDFGCLENVIENNICDIEKLRNRDIQSLDTADEPVIKELFCDFLVAIRIKEGRKKDCKSPVAVAKALHLLAPNFFPLWDDKIARAYGCYYKNDPEQKYLDFAFKMKTLSLQFQNHIPACTNKTFLKLIDEYNYAKYTKKWV